VYTTPTALTTALDGLNIANQNYGAVYFPNLTIADPASTVVGKTINVAPGGSVVAEYSATDTSVGAFKSPAGITNNIGGAVPVTTLLSTDFDIISSALKNVNIIRTVPGYGTCIMGARTIGSAYSDKYISVRRTLNYLEYNLKNNTQFAVFEPNDANLWSEVAAVASGILNDYWSKGGLAGATADQAFYVKCDSTINTPTTIGAGELHLEVGVALQRPAEFVVIKIGQINGGTTVTTTL
jgi:phage tail sheath protein FI